MVVLPACKGSGGASASIALRTQDIILDKDAHRIDVVDGNGKPLAERPTFTAAPPDVLVATSAGELRCLKSGEAVLEAVTAKSRAAKKVSCRIVANIEVSDPGALVLQDGVKDLAATAHSESGSELADIPFEVSSSDAKVVRVSALQATPVSVGNAMITVRAGKYEKKLPVIVHKRIMNEPILLNDGYRKILTLQPGKYQMQLELGTSRKVGITWTGSSASCNTERDAKVHVSQCTLTRAGSLMVENPSFLGLGLGSSADGNLALYEVP